MRRDHEGRSSEAKRRLLSDLFDHRRREEQSTTLFPSRERVLALDELSCALRDAARGRSPTRSWGERGANEQKRELFEGGRRCCSRGLEQEARERGSSRGGQGQGQGTRARESGGNQGLFLLAFKHLFRLCGFPGRSQRSSRRSPTGEGRKRAPPGKNAAARRGSDWPPPPPPLRRLLLLSTTRKTKKQPTHLSLFRSMITNGRHSRCLWGPGEGLGACFEFF